MDVVIADWEKKIKYFVPNILKLYFTMCDLCFHEFILLLILKSEESNSHVIKKNNNRKQAVKKKEDSNLFCLALIYTMSGNLDFCFLFLLQYIHSSSTEAFMLLALISMLR